MESIGKNWKSASNYRLSAGNKNHHKGIGKLKSIICHFDSDYLKWLNRFDVVSICSVRFENWNYGKMIDSPSLSFMCYIRIGFESSANSTYTHTTRTRLSLTQQIEYLIEIDVSSTLWLNTMKCGENVRSFFHVYSVDLIQLKFEWRQSHVLSLILPGVFVLFSFDSIFHPNK